MNAPENSIAEIPSGIDDKNLGAADVASWWSEPAALFELSTPCLERGKWD